MTRNDNSELIPVVGSSGAVGRAQRSQIPQTSAVSPEDSPATGSDYAPFPERELLEYASATPVKALSQTLRDAVLCHTALRERCLLAELENRRLSRRIWPNGS